MSGGYDPYEAWMLDRWDSYERWTDGEIVDVNGHALSCPAYNQPTFTLCTCGATERAGLPATPLSASTTANAERSRPILHTFTGGLAPESRTHDATKAQLGSMNYCFGTRARTATSQETVAAYKRIRDAVEASGAVLTSGETS